MALLGFSLEQSYTFVWKYENYVTLLFSGKDLFENFFEIRALFP